MATLLERKRIAHNRDSQGLCADCRLPMLADEADEICPWCEQVQGRKEADNAVQS